MTISKPLLEDFSQCPTYFQSPSANHKFYVQVMCSDTLMFKDTDYEVYKSTIVGIVYSIDLIICISFVISLSFLNNFEIMTQQEIEDLVVLPDDFTISISKALPTKDQYYSENQYKAILW